MSDADKLDLLRDKKKMAFDVWFYSIQRMDLLIITVSGAGIYLCLETMKYLASNKISMLGWVKFAGICFLISIIINFISQWSGKKANSYEMLRLDRKIMQSDNHDLDADEKISSHKLKGTKHDKRTTWLNNISLLAMLIGLFTITIYFCLIF